MRVLLSTRPKFASRIFEGSKKYEYRRVIFRREDVTKILVYASAPLCKVVGEFDIGGIVHEEPKKLWARTRKYAGIARKEFFRYFSDATKGYAIRVKNSRMYEKPLPLRDLMISAPPQSFMYLA